MKGFKKHVRLDLIGNRLDHRLQIKIQGKTFSQDLVLTTALTSAETFRVMKMGSMFMSVSARAMVATSIGQMQEIKQHRMGWKRV